LLSVLYEGFKGLQQNLNHFKIFKSDQSYHEEEEGEEEYEEQEQEQEQDGKEKDRSM
jgi:hypothetical protein